MASHGVIVFYLLKERYDVDEVPYVLATRYPYYPPLWALFTHCVLLFALQRSNHPLSGSGTNV